MTVSATTGRIPYGRACDRTSARLAPIDGSIDDERWRRAAATELLAIADRRGLVSELDEQVIGGAFQRRGHRRSGTPPRRCPGARRGPRRSLAPRAPEKPSERMAGSEGATMTTASASRIASRTPGAGRCLRSAFDSAPGPCTATVPGADGRSTPGTRRRVRRTRHEVESSPRSSAGRAKRRQLRPHECDGDLGRHRRQGGSGVEPALRPIAGAVARSLIAETETTARPQSAQGRPSSVHVSSASPQPVAGVGPTGQRVRARCRDRARSCQAVEIEVVSGVADDGDLGLDRRR